ncbi:hypothetical protein KKE60_06325 [Patescibacteria group bacterium]|nr:hypothetical protein [Patescibacteria group bacterium]
MSRKPFDRDLYNQYDAKARTWFRKILPEEWTTENNPRKTGVDMLVYDGEGELAFYVELEVKRKWMGKFCFSSLHLPERKKKYCNLKKPTLFIIFNATGSKYMCVWSKFVVKSKLEMVPNCYIKYGEKFFDIPVKDVDDDIEKALRRKWRQHTMYELDGE